VTVRHGQHQPTFHQQSQQLARVARVRASSLSQAAQVKALTRVREQRSQDTGLGFAAQDGDEGLEQLLFDLQHLLLKLQRFD
jgi:hypothetical protein